MRFGCYESKLYESDFIHITSSVETPISFEVKDQYFVLDQGDQGSCVSCAVTEMYYHACKEQNRELDLPYLYFYDNRADKSIDGMSIREALEMLVVDSKVFMFARIGSLDYIKKSLILNGPVVVGMEVRSQETQFWKGGDVLNVGHAVAVVGYNESGLLLKNSWGVSYGNDGYVILPYQDFSTIREAWILYS